MGLFGEDDPSPAAHKRRGRKPRPRRRDVELPVDSLLYKVEVEYVHNEIDEDEGGTVTIDFQLSSQPADVDIESHWPELNGNLSYKAPTGGDQVSDLANKISDAYAAVGHALVQWSKDAKKRLE